MSLYVLITAGILFTALFALNNLLKTIFRRNKIGFLDLLLAFMTTLVLLAGLILAQISGDALIPFGALAAGAALAAFSLLIILLEVFRAQRLRGSRGILGLYSGLLVIAAFFLVPFTSTYFAEAPATVVAQAVSGQGEATEEANALNPEQQQRAEALFNAITQAVIDEIDVEPSLITDALQNGTPLATIITENGGSVDNVVKSISEIMRAGVRDSAARGEINPIQAALALSQMENFIRIAVNSDLNVLVQQVGGATPDPNATRANLFEFATNESTEAPTLTASPTATASRTPAPTETRRPSNTPRPTRTPYSFSTRTPTPTPTLVTPCVASVEYNLRLRAAPNLDSETLLVIPYSTIIELYGRGEPTENGGRWWYAGYEGQQGWVDGQYMIVSNACDSLPLREAE